MYDSLLPKGQTEYMIEKYQSPAAVRRQISTEGYCYYTVYDGGIPCGFSGFIPNHKEKDELFLSKLYVMKECEGKGVARRLFEFISEKAHGFGCRNIWLTVNRGNSHAIEVYKHFGFEIASEAVTDIGKDYVMDDFIMRKVL